MIASTLHKFVGAVRANERPIVSPGFLRPIDTARIEQELNLSNFAAEQGRRELPDRDAQMLDMIEQKVVQRIESEWAWQGGELINSLRAYASRLVGFSIHAEYTKLRLTAKNALTRLRSASLEAGGELGHLRDSFIAARNELQDFRQRHKLNRPARNPARRWTTFGLLFVLVAVESILNGFFFAKGSQFGLLGGIGTAIGVSVTNVVFAFLAGLLPARWMNRRNLVIKLLGFMFTFSAVAVLVALHAFAMHFREATAVVGEDVAMDYAVRHLLQSPVGISDINSAYLFGLGLLFAFSAFWKGYTFDDPHPGYGAVYRRAVAARENYREEHDALFGELEEIKEETVSALKDGIGRLPLFPQLAAQARAERAGLLQDFRSYESSVETAANQLLAAYRDANRNARTTPAPAHFDQRWTLPHSLLTSAEVKTLTAEAEARPENVEAIVSDLHQLSEAVLQEYDKLLATYPHPTDIT